MAIFNTKLKFNAQQLMNRTDAMDDTMTDLASDYITFVWGNPDPAMTPQTAFNQFGTNGAKVVLMQKGFSAMETVKLGSPPVVLPPNRMTRPNVNGTVTVMDITDPNNPIPSEPNLDPMRVQS